MTNRVTPLQVAASTVILNVGPGDVPCRVSCMGLTTGEVFTLKPMLDGAPSGLGTDVGAADPTIGIYVTGIYQVYKPITTFVAAICVDGLPANSIDVV